MLVVAPDFARRVTLPGVGPCPRPIDLDQSNTGLSTLVSLRIYSFRQGMTIDGEAEADEVFITLMRGEAALAVTAGGRRSEDILGATTGPRALYMPPHSDYRLQARTDCDVAYARVRPRGSPPPAPRAFEPTDGRLDVIGYATAMDLGMASLDDGGTLAVGSGRENFMHLRSDDGASATADDTTFGDWSTLVLRASEEADLVIREGTAEVLHIRSAEGD